MRQLQHNPFARATLCKQPVRFYSLNGPTCAWCGSDGKHSIQNDECRTLYQIGWQSDNAAPNYGTNLYCSVSCYRAYNGE